MSTTHASVFVPACLVVLLFGTPLRGLWLHGGVPWWTPFATWAGIIIVIALGRRRS